MMCGKPNGPPAFLAATEIVDHHHPAVRKKARKLAGERTDPSDIGRACFDFVRDAIDHSGDFGKEPVTCQASEVLLYETGYCYAKSHLLVALLRANSIPAGFCYQRLTLDGHGPPFCLHGLCCVAIEPGRWYRADPRGNRDGIDARWSPPREQLAFRAHLPGECDLPEIWPEPLPSVVEVLTESHSIEQVAENLPDVLLWQTSLRDK